MRAVYCGTPFVPFLLWGVFHRVINRDEMIEVSGYAPHTQVNTESSL